MMASPQPDGGAVLALVGRPGAGKGTQGRLLANRLGVPTLSVGDLLRDAVETSSPLGRTIERYVSRGYIVPNRFVLDVLWTRLEDLAVRGRGVVLDGFPRNVRQALALEQMLNPRRLDLVIELSVQPAVATARLLARRRSDDGLETIQRRMDVHDRTTAAMIDWFRQSGRLATVEAHHPAGIVHEHLWEVVERATSDAMSVRQPQS
jgi:adenylate kinase